MMSSLDEFLKGYFEAMGFTATTDDEEEKALWTSSYSAEDVLKVIPEDSFKSLCEDCVGFLMECWKAGQTEILSSMNRAGHHFHYTRNGHGTGFWEGEWENGDALSGIAEVYGTAELWGQQGEEGPSECYICN